MSDVINGAMLDEKRAKIEALRPGLIAAYKAQTTYVTRVALARVLAFVPDQEIADLIVDKYPTADAVEQTHYGKILDQMGEFAARALYRRISTTENNKARVIWLNAMCDVSDPLMVKLAALLYFEWRGDEKDRPQVDSFARQRLADAIHASALNNHDAALPLLMGMLSDPVVEVRNTAALTIFDVVQRMMESDIERWDFRDDFADAGMIELINES